MRHIIGYLNKIVILLIMFIAVNWIAVNPGHTQEAVNELKLVLIVEQGNHMSHGEADPNDVRFQAVTNFVRQLTYLQYHLLNQIGVSLSIAVIYSNDQAQPVTFHTPAETHWLRLSHLHNKGVFDTIALNNALIPLEKNQCNNCQQEEPDFKNALEVAIDLLGDAPSLGNERRAILWLNSGGPTHQCPDSYCADIFGSEYIRHANTVLGDLFKTVVDNQQPTARLNKQHTSLYTLVLSQVYWTNVPANIGIIRNYWEDIVEGSGFIYQVNDQARQYSLEHNLYATMMGAFNEFLAKSLCDNLSLQSNACPILQIQNVTGNGSNSFFVPSMQADLMIVTSYDLDTTSGIHIFRPSEPNVEERLSPLQYESFQIYSEKYPRPGLWRIQKVTQEVIPSNLHQNDSVYIYYSPISSPTIHYPSDQQVYYQYQRITVRVDLNLGLEGEQTLPPNSSVSVIPTLLQSSDQNDETGDVTLSSIRLEPVENLPGVFGGEFIPINAGNYQLSTHVSLAGFDEPSPAASSTQISVLPIDITLTCQPANIPPTSTTTLQQIQFIAPDRPTWQLSISSPAQQFLPAGLASQLGIVWGATWRYSEALVPFEINPITPNETQTERIDFIGRLPEVEVMLYNLQFSAHIPDQQGSPVKFKTIQECNFRRIEPTINLNSSNFSVSQPSQVTVSAPKLLEDYSQENLNLEWVLSEINGNIIDQRPSIGEPNYTPDAIDFIIQPNYSALTVGQRYELVIKLNRKGVTIKEQTFNVQYVE